MLAVGVQTWGTDVRALERYWQAADEPGHARISYGDGLGARHRAHVAIGRP